jgi:hypothetical protein
MNPRAFLAGIAAVIGCTVYIVGDLVLIAATRAASSHRTSPAELADLVARMDRIAAARTGQTSAI